MGHAFDSRHLWVRPGRIVERVRARSRGARYFYGCSTGGIKATRRSSDTRGFRRRHCGCAGNNRIRLNAGFLWQFLSNHRPVTTQHRSFQPRSCPLITRAVVAACDANDGVKDGVVDDPRTAGSIRPRSRAGDGQTECLSPRQVVALRRCIGRRTRGPVRRSIRVAGEQRGADRISAGPPVVGMAAVPGEARSPPERRFGVTGCSAIQLGLVVVRLRSSPGARRRARRRNGRSGEPRSRASKPAAARPSSTRAGRIRSVNALDTIAYYEQVRRARARSRRSIDSSGCSWCRAWATVGRHRDDQLRQPERPAPIVDADHDLLSALDAWVERGAAPARLIASRVVDGATGRRALCAPIQ